MTDKSHVSMEQHQCFVCGTLYDTGAVLLDKRMRKSMLPHTVTGYGLCSEHQKLKDAGFVALIEKPKKSEERTGRVMHVRDTAFVNLFTTPVPEQMVAFVEQEVFEKLLEVSIGIAGATGDAHD